MQLRMWSVANCMRHQPTWVLGVSTFRIGLKSCRISTHNHVLIEKNNLSFAKTSKNMKLVNHKTKEKLCLDILRHNFVFAHEAHQKRAARCSNTFLHYKDCWYVIGCWSSFAFLFGTGNHWWRSKAFLRDPALRPYSSSSFSMQKQNQIEQKTEDCSKI